MILEEKGWMVVLEENGWMILEERGYGGVQNGDWAAGARVGEEVRVVEGGGFAGAGAACERDGRGVEGEAEEEGGDTDSRGGGAALVRSLSRGKEATLPVGGTSVPSGGVAMCRDANDAHWAGVSAGQGATEGWREGGEPSRDEQWRRAPMPHGGSDVEGCGLLLCRPAVDSSVAVERAFACLFVTPAVTIKHRTLHQHKQDILNHKHTLFHNKHPIAYN